MDPVSILVGGSLPAFRTERSFTAGIIKHEGLRFSYPCGASVSLSRLPPEFPRFGRPVHRSLRPVVPVSVPEGVSRTLQELHADHFRLHRRQSQIPVPAGKVDTGFALSDNPNRTVNAAVPFGRRILSSGNSPKRWDDGLICPAGFSASRRSSGQRTDAPVPRRSSGQRTGSLSPFCLPGCTAKSPVLFQSVVRSVSFPARSDLPGCGSGLFALSGLPDCGAGPFPLSRLPDCPETFPPEASASFFPGASDSPAPAAASFFSSDTGFAIRSVRSP